MLAAANTRDALLKSPTLELAFSYLKVIYEVCVKHCMSCEYLETSPLLAYTTLVLHKNLQKFELSGKNGPSCNDELNFTGLSSDPMRVDNSLNDLFGCTEKLFSATEFESNSHVKSKQVKKHKKSKKEADSSSPDNSSSFSEQKKIFNMVKMVSCATSRQGLCEGLD